MFARIIIFILLAWISIINSYSQSLVRGKVIDNNTSEGLPGVHILYGSTSGVLSEADGNFSFTAVPGAYRLTFRFLGYRTTYREIRLKEGDTLVLNIKLIQDITSIDEITVSAGKREQKIAELSVSMNVLKPYQVSRFHITKAEDLLHRTTGIEIIDGQASIRGGSGYSYGAGSRVLSLIDGLPALSADAGNVKWGTLPLENISRVEVIKGASSVLYGSSALNGVINFITRDAASEPLTRLSISSGIYDKPANKDWVWWDSPRMIQNISFSHSKQYGNNKLGIGLSALNDNGYRRLNNDRKLRLSIDFKHKCPKYKSLRYGWSGYVSYNAKNDFLLWENAWDGALIQSESTAMEYRGLSMAVDPFISFSGSREGKHEIKGRVLTNLNRLPGNENNNSDSYSAYLEYQYSLELTNRISVVSGLLEQYSIINSMFYGNHKGLNLAGYSQADLEISEKFRAVAGFRIEEYILNGEADRPVPVFRSGINYQAGRSTFLRASFGQGYRYPSIAEKHAYTVVGAVRIFPNEEINSEKGWSAELGLKQKITDSYLSGEFDLALYYSQNKDMIEYVFGSYRDPVSGANDMGFMPVNIENSRVYGFETELRLYRSFGEFNTSLEAGYTYMYPVEFNAYSGENTDKYLKYRRKHAANISINTTFRKVQIGTTAYYKSRMLDIDDVFLGPMTRENILPGFYDYWLENNKGYFMADVQGAYRFNTRYSLSLSIKNITNTEYMGRPGDIRPHRYYSLMFDILF